MLVTWDQTETERNSCHRAIWANMANSIWVFDLRKPQIGITGPLSCALVVGRISLTMGHPRFFGDTWSTYFHMAEIEEPVP